MKVRETDIAAPIVEYLKDLHWDVYQEVLIGGPVADIVATQTGVVWIVEVKTNASLRLLYQAIDWQRYWQRVAHKISVAVPHSRGGFATICSALGIGLFEVHYKVHETVKPQFTRLPDPKRIQRWLSEAQKTGASAGTANGGHHTPFKATCKSLREFLQINGPVTVKECIDNIDYHWSSPSSARNCLYQWAKRDILIGVTIVSDSPLKLGLRKEAA